MARIFRFSFLIWLLLLAAPRAWSGLLEIRIGFVLPLSGEWAFLGEGVRDAALLAERDSKAKSSTLKLFFEDNHGQLKDSASAAQFLIENKKVDAIVSIISGVGLLIQPIAERSGVLNFGLCSNTDVANASASFTNYITTEEGARAYLSHLRKLYPSRARVGVFSLNEAGFNQIVEQLKIQAPKNSVEISFVEFFEPDVRDFKTLVLKHLKNPPDVVLLLGLSPGLEIMAKQIRELKIMLPLTSIEAFGLAGDKRPFEGGWYIDAAAASPEFEQAFRISYGRGSTAAAAHAYATVQLVRAGFEGASRDGHKASTKDVAAYLRTQENFSSIVGTLEVDAKGVVHSTPSVKVIKDGQGVVSFTPQR